jgi:hypothetical protein
MQFDIKSQNGYLFLLMVPWESSEIGEGEYDMGDHGGNLGNGGNGVRKVEPLGHTAAIGPEPPQRSARDAGQC